MISTKEADENATWGQEVEALKEIGLVTDVAKSRCSRG